MVICALLIMLKTSVRLPVYHSPTPHLTILGGIQVVRRNYYHLKRYQMACHSPFKKVYYLS